MERIILGRTGLEINRVGFGGIPIQTVSEEQAVETVLHAVNAGVDFIDTSRAYTTSERRIGLALKQTERRVVVASKSPSRQWTDLRTDLETSLRELQREYIDLYQCHFVRNLDDYNQVIAENGALACLQQARAEGLIGHIGITSHSLDVLARAVADDRFDTVMACFSFLEPKAAETVIPAAFEKNIGVIAMKSFSGGVIDDAALALKFALSQPGVAIIPGVESTALFDLNWSVYTRGDFRLTEVEQQEIARIRSRWDKAFCRRCDYCQPCTEQIPISVVLHLKTIVKRMGEAAVRPGGLLAAGIAAARNCVECGECEERCPYELPVPELIRENLDWLDNRSG